MDKRILTVKEHLERLSSLDTTRVTLCAKWHDYALEPPLDHQVIELFEAKHDVRLPEDYRYFLLNIGNGGAGPAYGVFPFGMQDAGDELEDWNSYLVGNFSEPFPHERAWNIPCPELIEEGDEDLNEEILNKFDAIYWAAHLVNGAIPICHLGCALRQWLVIKGPQAGYVWADDRADNNGLYPLFNSNQSQMTFTDWYFQWIDESYAELEGA